MNEHSQVNLRLSSGQKSAAKSFFFCLGDRVFYSIKNPVAQDGVVIKLQYSMSHPYETIAAFILAHTRYRPEVGIICGSGLSGLSKNLQESQTFQYNDIPGFPKATVAGHTGELVFGVMDGIQCVCMRGRFHYYEGNSMEQVVLPVRVMRLLGVKLLIGK